MNKLFICRTSKNVTEYEDEEEVTFLIRADDAAKAFSILADAIRKNETGNFEIYICEIIEAEEGFQTISEEAEIFKMESWK